MRPREMGAHLICVHVPGSKTPDGFKRLHTAQRLHPSKWGAQSSKRKLTIYRQQLSWTTMPPCSSEIRNMSAMAVRNGYVLPPNSLYRPFDEALSILDKTLNIYQGKV